MRQQVQEPPCPARVVCSAFREDERENVGHDLTRYTLGLRRVLQKQRQARHRNSRGSWHWKLLGITQHHASLGFSFVLFQQCMHDHSWGRWAKLLTSSGTSRASQRHATTTLTEDGRQSWLFADANHRTQEVSTQKSLAKPLRDAPQSKSAVSTARASRHPGFCAFGHNAHVSGCAAAPSRAAKNQKVMQTVSFPGEIDKGTTARVELQAEFP